LAALPFPLMLFPYLFMDSGVSDPWLPDARRFEDVLTEFHVPHDFMVYPGDHSEAYWQAHMSDYIQQLAISFPKVK